MRLRPRAAALLLLGSTVALLSARIASRRNVPGDGPVGISTSQAPSLPNVVVAEASHPPPSEGTPASSPQNALPVLERNWTEFIRPGERIPRIHHFVFTSNGTFTWKAAERAKEFGLVEYAAIRSVHDVLKPDVIFFYYIVEPSGIWWDRAKPMVTPEQIPAVTDIYGKRVRHPAHQSDFVRLNKIVERGGVYHDLDVIALRKYPDDWYRQGFVMAKEHKWSLCNAVMMSAINSTFGNIWLDKYRDFDDSTWNRFNVVLPKELSGQYPQHILVLPMSAFFVPAGERSAILLMQGNEPLWDWRKHPEQYAYHMWSQAVKKFAPDRANPNISTVFAVNSSFNLILRRFMDPEFLVQY